MIVNRDSVLGSGPVDDYHLTWNLSLLGIQLEQIRADRVLQEALSIDSDPLHLAHAFGLSERTAVDYSMIARTLTERPSAPRCAAGAGLLTCDVSELRDGWRVEFLADREADDGISVAVGGLTRPVSSGP
jgi:hypothetical protein